MRKYFYAALLTLFALASCHKSDDDSCVEEIIRRLDNLESAVATLEQKIEDGALIKSVTPIPGTPGGWRIEFTGGTPSSIDIVNGTNGTNGTNGVTPKIEVHPNPDGSASLWVDDGSGWRNTNVDLYVFDISTETLYRYDIGEILKRLKP